MLKIHFPIYVLLIILNLILIVTIKYYSNKHDAIEDKIESINDCLIASIFSINDTFINYDYKLLESDERQISLSDITKSGNMFVLYFTENVCESCLLSLLNIVNKKEFSLISDNLIFITSFSRFNSFKLFMSNHNYNFKAYCIENEVIKLTKIDTSNPCFFMLDDDLVINHLFVHNKNYELSTELYLEKIINLYNFNEP